MPTTNHSFEEFFVERLKDIYDAEKRITKALPKMVKSASSPELSSAFQEHLQQTEVHVQRLEQVFENLDRTPGRKPCHGMMGILEEGSEMMEKSVAGPVMDAGLIAAAQDVEHYEICSYGTLRTWAELLGHDEEARMLQQTLDEEGETDKRLTELAESINKEAVEHVRENGGADEAVPVPVRRTSSSTSRSTGKRSSR